jgi:predicted dehydrogenase
MNRPLRVGIVGCGNVAVNFHVPAYLAVPQRFEVAGLADPVASQLGTGMARARLSAREVHADAYEMFARDDIDVVDVCTPQHLHRDLVVAAALAGKHVLCEKPIAAVPADAEAMIAAATQAGVVLAVVHNYLFFPEVIAAREVIASGEIGDVRTVSVDMLGVVDSPGASGYQPRWRHDPTAAGGGVLMDMLHAVYLAELFLGAPVVRVSAYVDGAIDGDAVEGLALSRLEAEHGAALVNVGWGLGRGGVQVSGTKGRLAVCYRDDGTCPWAPFERLTVTTASGTRSLPLPPGQELVDLVTTALRHTVVDLADAIEDQRPPAADGRAALRTLEATVATYASAALGHAVGVPLATDSALHRSGVMGLAQLDVPDWSPVRQHGLFGLVPANPRS